MIIYNKKFNQKNSEKSSFQVKFRVSLKLEKVNFISFGLKEEKAV